MVRCPLVAHAAGAAKTLHITVEDKNFSVGSKRAMPPVAATRQSAQSWKPLNEKKNVAQTSATGKLFQRGASDRCTLTRAVQWPSTSRRSSIDMACCLFCGLDACLHLDPQMSNCTFESKESGPERAAECSPNTEPPTGRATDADPRSSRNLKQKSKKSPLTRHHSTTQHKTAQHNICGLVSDRPVVLLLGDGKVAGKENTRSVFVFVATSASQCCVALRL